MKYPEDFEIYAFKAHRLGSNLCFFFPRKEKGINLRKNIDAKKIYIEKKIYIQILLLK
jgi:hypothetical protein